MPNDVYRTEKSCSTSHRRTCRWGGSGASGEAGVALLVVISALVLVLALASALVLTSLVETRIAAVSRDDVLALSASHAVAARVLADLRSADWNSVLAGAVSTFSDGPPVGSRHLPDGTTLELERETAELQCGRPTGCTDADVATVSEERPWGAGNPRWRLFAYGPLSGLLPGDPAPPEAYVLAWVADDPVDGDGDPARDADAVEDPGRDVLMVAGRAYGPGGTRRTVQMVVQRVGTELRVLTVHERQP